MSGEVVVLGSMNLDTVVRLDALPRSGETKFGSHVFKSPGGKSSNQAVAIAKSGLEPILIAAIGEDSDGSWLVQEAASHGVDVSHVFKLKSAPTGAAFIMVDESAENFIVVAPGANSALDRLTVSSVLSKLRDPFRALVVAMEIKSDVIRESMVHARQIGALTFLNPSPFSHDAISLIGLADFIIVNQGENELLSHALRASMEELPSVLANLGVRHLIVTKGPEGCIHYDLEADTLSAKRFAAPIIKSVDTTGCGDAFLGSLVSMFVQTRDVQESIKFALKAASYAALSQGAQPSYGKRAEIELKFSTHSFF